MKIKCDRTDTEESTVCIEGEDYWTAVQFANLTNRTVGCIRVLANKGNRLGRLKSENINGRLYVHAKELFDFPFVVNGHPANMGDFVEMFYLDEETGELLREEKNLKREEKESEDSDLHEGA